MDKFVMPEEAAFNFIKYTGLPTEAQEEEAQRLIEIIKIQRAQEREEIAQRIRYEVLEGARCGILEPPEVNGLRRIVAEMEYYISIPCKIVRGYTIQASSPEEAYQKYLNEPNGDVKQDIEDEDIDIDSFGGGDLKIYFLENLEGSE